MQIAIHATDEYAFDRRSLKRFVTYQTLDSLCCTVDKDKRS